MPKISIPQHGHGVGAKYLSSQELLLQQPLLICGDWRCKYGWCKSFLTHASVSVELQLTIGRALLEAAVFPTCRFQGGHQRNRPWYRSGWGLRSTSIHRPANRLFGMCQRRTCKLTTIVNIIHILLFKLVAIVAQSFDYSGLIRGEIWRWVDNGALLTAIQMHPKRLLKPNSSFVYVRTLYYDCDRLQDIFAASFVESFERLLI